MALKPEVAKDKIRKAYRKSGCSFQAVADSFGFNVWTLQRYVRKLQLGDELAEVKAKALEEGWHHKPAPGPGRGHKREGSSG